MKRFAVVCAVIVVLAACSADGSDDVVAAASTTAATSTSSTNSTLVATTLAVTTTLGAVTTPTPTPVCSAPASHDVGQGIVVRPPVTSSLKCEAGWRMFGWIGESGDGILLIQHLSGASWVTDYYGPGCGGVASAPSDELVGHGLPRALADKWGGGCG